MDTLKKSVENLDNEFKAASESLALAKLEAEHASSSPSGKSDVDTLSKCIKELGVIQSTLDVSSSPRLGNSWECSARMSCPLRLVVSPICHSIGVSPLFFVYHPLFLSVSCDL